jgi:hypothetical protein
MSRLFSEEVRILRVSRLKIDRLCPLRHSGQESHKYLLMMLVNSRLLSRSVNTKKQVHLVPAEPSVAVYQFAEWRTGGNGRAGIARRSEPLPPSTVPFWKPGSGCHYPKPAAREAKHSYHLFARSSAAAISGPSALDANGDVRLLIPALLNQARFAGKVSSQSGIITRTSRREPADLG